MSSTLNPDEEPQQVVKQTSGTTGTLGPSDSSDSGSDVAGEKRHEFDVETELDNHALETGEAELRQRHRSRRARASAPQPTAIRRSTPIATSSPITSCGHRQPMTATTVSTRTPPAFNRPVRFTPNAPAPPPPPPPPPNAGPAGGAARSTGTRGRQRTCLAAA